VLDIGVGDLATVDPRLAAALTIADADVPLLIFGETGTRWPGSPVRAARDECGAGCAFEPPARQAPPRP
jgi:hypothetical protein